METLNVYLSEIKNLEVSATDELINSSRYYNVQPEFSTKLEDLQETALKDLALLPYAEIKQQLISVKRLERSFSKFDAIYPDLVNKSEKGVLSAQELKTKTGPLFNNIRLDEKTISLHFVTSIYSSILSKHHSLTRLINKIEDLLVTLKKTKMHFA
jgi:hypothetical protein